MPTEILGVFDQDDLQVRGQTVDELVSANGDLDMQGYNLLNQGNAFVGDTTTEVLSSGADGFQALGTVLLPVGVTAVDILVVGSRQGAPGEAAMYRICGLIHKVDAGNISVIGSLRVETIHEYDPQWDVTIIPGGAGNDTYAVAANSGASQFVNWKATHRHVTVS